MAVIAVGIILAVAANLYLFSTGEDLTQVVTQTLFADTIVVLTLVPIIESIRVRKESKDLQIQTRVKSGMKTVTLYTFFIAITTYILFKLFGEPLIAERLNMLTELLDNAISEGTVTVKEKTQRIEFANQIYSPYSQVLIVIMANLVVGFISSILAAMLIRK